MYRFLNLILIFEFLQWPVRIVDSNNFKNSSTLRSKRNPQDVYFPGAANVQPTGGFNGGYNNGINGGFQAGGYSPGGFGPGGFPQGGFAQGGFRPGGFRPGGRGFRRRNRLRRLQALGAFGPGNGPGFGPGFGQGRGPGFGPGFGRGGGPGFQPPPPGFSGWRPNRWGQGFYGERHKRISQLKFEEYMRRIYGNENYDENNDILKPEDLNGRVIAAPGEFPHIAVIGIRIARFITDWKCGGSLISIFFVMTAAHCTSFGGEPPNKVKVGDVNLKVREDTVATQRFRIDNIYRHPSYKDDLNYHDIALIRLNKPAVFTRHVRPARLWAANEVPFEKAFAVGYGATRFGATPTEVLTFFNLSLIAQNECKQKMPANSGIPSGIVDSQLCALDLDKHRDTCQGDSGGPLELHLPGRRRIRYYVIGITSFGVSCGSPTPSVYTKIFSYLDWIESIVWPPEENQEFYRGK